MPPTLSSNKTLIAVVGPTAVGKTATAIEIAQHFKGEVVSADSRQFFKELSIGTAKPSLEELGKVPHHFIDSRSIQDLYDAAQYGFDARDLIDQRFRELDHLVLCGGSGLYLKSVLVGLDDMPVISPEIRGQLVQGFQENGLAWLQTLMLSEDPEYFAIIDQRNSQRMIRALEVKLGTGKSISFFQQNNEIKHSFNIIKIGLEVPRGILYQRIDERMDKMIAEGLFEEAEKLYELRHINALQTVGYKEIFEFLDGKYDRTEAIRLLKRNSRHYAKRQITWFKADTQIRWFDPVDTEAIIDYINANKNMPRS